MAYKVGKILCLSSRVERGSLGERRSAPTAPAAAAAGLLAAAAAVLPAEDIFLGGGRRCGCRCRLWVAAAVGAVEMTVVMQDIAGKGDPVVE